MDKKSTEFGDTLLGSSEIFVRFFVGFVVFLATSKMTVAP